MSEVYLGFEDDGDAGVGGVIVMNCQCSLIFFFLFLCLLFLFWGAANRGAGCGKCR